MHADPHHEHDQRHHRRDLVPRDLGHGSILFFRDRAEENALHEPQEIDRSEDHSRRRDNRCGRMGLERSGQDQEFADEAIQSRQADRREHGDHEERRIKRHRGRQAAVVRQHASVPALVDHSDQQEERAG